MATPKTPLEISDYKARWKPNAFIVPVHSDLDWRCKDWCRKNLERWEWSMDTYTGVYEHTFYFEKEDVAIEFENQWAKRH